MLIKQTWETRKKAGTRIGYALLLSSAMALTACGGGGSGGSSSGDNAKTPPAGNNTDATVGGEAGTNPCVTGNIVDMKCYMVPGDTGDKPVIKETVYQWNGANNNFESQGERTRTLEIKANSATISVTGALSAGAQTGYSWNTEDFTVTNPDSSTATFKRSFTLGSEQTVTEVSGSDTIESRSMVFGPKSRTLTIPGTNNKITANNAILRVIIQKDIPLAHVAVLIPNRGVIAQISYLGCKEAKEAGSLTFVDDANYYETTCGHIKFLGKKGDTASLRKSFDAEGASGGPLTSVGPGGPLTPVGPGGPIVGPGTPIVEPSGPIIPGNLSDRR